MRFITKITNILLSVAVLSGTTITQSCSEDKIGLPDYTVSGKDVSFRFSLTLPDMEKMTRSEIPEYDLNRVNNVWIRTYSPATKEATSEWKKLTGLDHATTEFTDGDFTINTKSGNAYIVAVANVENLGVTKSDPTAKPVALSTLLEAADTWDKFLDIAVVSPSDFERTLAPEVPLPMAGCYIPGLTPGSGHPANLGYYGQKDFEPVFIPAPASGSSTNEVSMSDGAIHLRRLVSHITFNMIPGANLDLNVESYRLVNIPRFSWLYERPNGETAGTGGTNFGDLALEKDIATYYANNIEEFSNQYVTKNTDGSSTFDFWQSENKHTGTSETYAKRGLQNGDGLFTSLTGETWTPDNLATYVLVSCSIDYKKDLTVNDKGEILDENSPDGSAVKRTGEARYLIHLGYIDGNGLSEADKSKDFNCYRNVDYTYNVHVNGVNDIRLDAYAEGDYPNQEGIVVDLEEKLIGLDAHYGVFNIQLTQSELEDPNFGFIIHSYYGAASYNFTETSDLSGIDENLYNWIELRATPDSTTLAYYKPRYGDNTNPDDNNQVYSGKKTFMLADLKSSSSSRGPWRDMNDDWKSPSGWYTVFINEYTYEQIYTPETEADGTYGNETQDGNDRWMHYVNRSPRRFYITTKKQVSDDGKTIYARSRVGVEQESIQTYYSAIKPTEGETYTENGVTYTIQAGTAVGVERENETEGLNMRDTYGGGSDPNNGRWNVAQYLGGQARTETTLNINNSSVSDRPAWSTFIKQTTPMTREAVTGTRAQNGPDLPARDNDNPIPIPALVMLQNQSSYFNDPQAANEAIEAINACTSRNRDNNGNGRIDPEELRWYVPAIGKYLRLILGRNSMGETPLMNYASVKPGLPKVSNYSWSTQSGSWNDNGTIDNGACSRYFFAGSNFFGNNHVQVVWGMEGMSTSYWGSWSGNPWQVRCLRNLGTDLRSVSQGHKVSMAYKRREGTDIVELSYYDAASIRPYKLQGNGNGAGQMPIHVSTDNAYNMAYKAFEFKTNADDDIQVPSDSVSLVLVPAFINTNPCNKYGKEWRVPNQYELAVMRNLGIFPENSPVYKYWISCSTLYFSTNTGLGSSTYNDDIYKELFITSKSHGTRLSQNNIQNNNGFWVRCVRDVD